LEKKYPYKSSKQNCQKSIHKYNYKIKRIIDLYSNKGNERHLQQALVKYGPIATYIHHNHESFKSYSSGIYYESSCKPKETTHVVLIVGYGSDKGHDYWIIKNSMGTGWGEKGYMRIARNKNNHCGIASYPYVIDNEE
jgi:cathepsin L